AIVTQSGCEQVIEQSGCLAAPNRKATNEYGFETRAGTGNGPSAGRFCPPVGQGRGEQEKACGPWKARVDGGGFELFAGRRLAGVARPGVDRVDPFPDRPGEGRVEAERLRRVSARSGGAFAGHRGSGVAVANAIPGGQRMGEAVGSRVYQGADRYNRTDP